MSIRRVRCIFHNDPNSDRPDYVSTCKCCPRGRSGHRIVVTSNFLYSVGGFNPLLGSLAEPIGIRGFPLLKELWRFNLSTREWQLLDDYYSVPATIASHTVACLGRWLFLFGGTSIPFGETPSNHIYRYNLSLGAHPLIKQAENNDVSQLNEDVGADETGSEVEAIHPSRSRWQIIPVEGDVPAERYGHSMILKFPDAYIIGGTSGYVYNADVFHLNLSQPTGRWTKLSWDGDPKQPPARYRHETAFDGRKLYVFGGGTEIDAFSLIVIHAFDVTERCWNSIRSSPDPIHGYPKSRKCHSCCQLKNDVVLAGGISRTSSANIQTLFDDVWKFSLVTLTWKKLGVTLPQQIYFHSADICEAKGLMYIFGGAMSSGSNAVRTQQIWSIRVGVSSLLELAWDVICDYAGPRCNKKHMKELDLPAQLMDRL